MANRITGRIIHYDFKTPITQTKVPTRIYVHQAGAEVWGRDLNAVKTKFERDFDKHIEKFPETENGVPNFDYMLAVLWGNQGARIIDGFGYKEFDALEGDAWRNSNPEISIWNLQNGVFVPKTSIRGSSAACKDGIEVINGENKHIEHTNSLADFLTHPPELERFRPFWEYDACARYSEIDGKVE